MKNFKIQTRESQMEEDELLAIVSEQLGELEKLGFDAKIAKVGETYCLKIIDRNGQVYADACDEHLSPGTVSYLAEFVEDASVQKALDSMTPRIMKMGWGLRYNGLANLTKDRRCITITRPGGQVTNYDVTGSDMLSLRLELDVAEVDWLLGNAMPLFDRVNWRLVRNDGNHTYTVFRDKGYVVVETGDVKMAKQLIEDLQRRLSIYNQPESLDKEVIE